MSNANRDACVQCIDIMEIDIERRVRLARVRTLIRRDPTLEASAKTLEHSHVVDEEALTPSLADIEYDRLLRQAYVPHRARRGAALSNQLTELPSQVHGAGGAAAGHATAREGCGALRARVLHRRPP